MKSNSAGFTKIVSVFSIVLLLTLGLFTLATVKRETTLKSEASSLITTKLVLYQNSGDTPQVFQSTKAGLFFSPPIQLTTKGVNMYPVYVGNGQKIIFISDRDGVSEIYSMNSNGSSQTRLTTTNKNINQYAGNWYPKVSPQGTKIVYESSAHRPNGFDIFVADFDGTRLTNTIPLTNTGGAVSPVFSADGTKIFYYERTTKTLRSISPSGHNDTEVKKMLNEIAEGSISASKDGTELVFASYPLIGGNPFIQKISVDGTNLTQLTTLQTLSASPAFTPDNNSIVFIRRVSGTDQIWIMNKDGTNQKQLLKTTGHAGVSSGTPMTQVSNFRFVR